MVKLCASLLSLTLTASLALAAPYPSYTHGDLDEEFSRREYLLDTSDDLAARDPSFFSGFENAVEEVGRVAANGLHVAEKIAKNPVVQAATSVIPGGGAILAAEKAVGTIGKYEDKARDASRVVGDVLRKGRKIEKEIRKDVNEVGRRVGGFSRLFEGKFGKAMIQRHVNAPPPHHATRTHRPSRYYRRDLEDNEELSRRDFDDEELFGREYDDFLAERDFFDDLD